MKTNDKLTSSSLKDEKLLNIYTNKILFRLHTKFKCASIVKPESFLFVFTSLHQENTLNYYLKYSCCSHKK